jgi:hypothetical protein
MPQGRPEPIPAGTDPSFQTIWRPGDLALFEIEDNSSVAVLAMRHQLEDNDH